MEDLRNFRLTRGKVRVGRTSSFQEICACDRRATQCSLESLQMDMLEVGKSGLAFRISRISYHPEGDWGKTGKKGFRTRRKDS